MTAFEELGVIPQLGEAVSDLGWELPTPIQCEAVPAILGGGDVLIAAETGSGKTGAFCLPVVQIVWEKRKDALDPKGSPINVSNSWRLNMADRDRELGIAADGLSCESRSQGKAWFGCRATGLLHSHGKYYYEVKITRDGLCRVGWSTSDANHNIGTDNKSFGFGGTGKKSHNRNFEDYGTSFTTGDVLGCYLDIDSSQIWWAKNGQEFPVAYNVPNSMLNSHCGLHPAVLVQNSSLQLNFGDSPFAYPPSKGFIGVSQSPPNSFRWKGGPSGRAKDSNAPLCVVLEPTRELVDQTHNNLVLFSKKLEDPSIRCVSMATDQSIQTVMSKLKEGCDIVTGSAQRVNDMAEQGCLNLSALQFIVIDEADQFLADKQGGAQLLRRIFSKLPLVTPDGSKLQIIACSATLHNMNITRFADENMHFPQWIDLKGMDSVAETIHHVVCMVDAFDDKQWIRLKHDPNHLEDDHVHDSDRLKFGSDDQNTLSLGTKILKGVYVLKAIQSLKMEQAIIFCRTKQQCDHMETFLIAHGLNAGCLHGDRAPEVRKSTLHKFKDQTLAFLICTDVAARGIDVTGIPFVINVTLPDEKEVYLHRIGRVGRADRMGLSISLVSSKPEKVWYHTCRSRGVNCTNTDDVKNRGCTIWYDEPRILSDIEEHIGQTISIVNSDFQIPVDEFEGKIVYGARRTQGATFEGHAPELAESVAQLADLERLLQSSYLASVQTTFLKLRSVMEGITRNSPSSRAHHMQDHRLNVSCSPF